MNLCLPIQELNSMGLSVSRATWHFCICICCICIFGTNCNVLTICHRLQEQQVAGWRSDVASARLDIMIMIIIIIIIVVIIIIIIIIMIIIVIVIILVVLWKYPMIYFVIILLQLYGEDSAIKSDISTNQSSLHFLAPTGALVVIVC